MFYHYFIFRTYGKTCFISIHILTSCYTETALLASYISFHNKERSAVVEIFFFYTAAAQQREKEEICVVWNCLSKVVLLI